MKRFVHILYTVLAVGMVALILFLSAGFRDDVYQKRNSSLVFYSIHQNAEVYIEDEMVYSMKAKDDEAGKNSNVLRWENSWARRKEVSS